MSMIIKDSTGTPFYKIEFNYQVPGTGTLSGLCYFLHRSYQDRRYFNFFLLLNENPQIIPLNYFEINFLTEFSTEKLVIGIEKNKLFPTHFYWSII